MTLEPVAGEAGHWRDPDWDGASAGTFAIIIGCSKYPYFMDGDQVGAVPMRWMKEAQRLGQLYVSALTGRTFFDWLSGEYTLDGAPPVSCRMLLSPTTDELAADPRLGENLLDPTLPNCKQAIAQWLGDINGLSKAAREASRIMFFFSGHGLQSTQDQQILLPSDYLGDGLLSYDHALSTQNLLHGLKTLQVPYRYYFLDACRNDSIEIKQMRPKGDQFLPVYPTSENYPDIETDAMLYATTEAQQAWQPTHPNDGPSLYGRALLDGLRGTPSIQLQTEASKLTVGFFALEEYMNERIKELLAAHHSTDTQRVQPGGLTRPRAVTELPIDFYDGMFFGASPSPSQPGAPAAPMGFNDLADVVEFQNFAKTRNYAEAFDFDAPQENLSTFEFSRAVPVSLQSDMWRTDFNIGHDLFGHETVTSLFSYTLQVAALEQRRWLDTNDVKLLRVDRTEIPASGVLSGEKTATSGHPEQTRYRIVLGIPNHDNVGHWLQVSGMHDGAVGVFLPQVEVVCPDIMAQYVLHVDVTHLRGPDIYGPMVTTMTAAPMAVGDTPIAEATRIWLRYQKDSARSAVTNFEGSQLEELLRGKLASPMAAIIAASVLLRADRLDLLHDWLRNVADWFPQYSDGAVFWAEQVMRQEKDPQRAVIEATKYLVTIPDRGLPMTSEGLSYAASLLDRLTPDRQIMDDATRTRFDEAQALVEEALVLFRPSGLFTSFANFDVAASAPIPDGLAPPVQIVPDGIMIHGILLALGNKD